jgi:hypothetical protein
VPRFLNTKGQPTLGIAICSRCQTKRLLGELTSDGNIPGFMVCLPHISPGCWDNYDPMRLPPRQTDRMTLPFYRPDQPLTVEPPEGLPPLEPPKLPT